MFGGEAAKRIYTACPEHVLSTFISQWRQYQKVRYVHASSLVYDRSDRHGLRSYTYVGIQDSCNDRNCALDSWFISSFREILLLSPKSQRIGYFSTCPVSFSGRCKAMHSFASNHIPRCSVRKYSLRSPCPWSRLPLGTYNFFACSMALYMTFERHRDLAISFSCMPCSYAVSESKTLNLRFYTVRFWTYRGIRVLIVSTSIAPFPPYPPSPPSPPFLSFTCKPNL